jgi:hypothetical protein
MVWGTALGCRCQSTKPLPLPWAVASPPPSPGLLQAPPLTPTLAAPYPCKTGFCSISNIFSAVVRDSQDCECPTQLCAWRKQQLHCHRSPLDQSASHSSRPPPLPFVPPTKSSLPPPPPCFTTKTALCPTPWGPCSKTIFGRPTGWGVSFSSNAPHPTPLLKEVAVAVTNNPSPSS